MTRQAKDEEREEHVHSHLTSALLLSADAQDQRSFSESGLVYY